MVCEVGENPSLHFADDLSDEQAGNHLPVVHCRECGSLGWAGVKRQHESHIIPDLTSFYMSFFKNDPKVIFIFPEEADGDREIRDSFSYLLCGSCLCLTQRDNKERCPECGNRELLKVFVPLTRAQRNNRMMGTHNCPYCNGFNSLTILGSRAASLTSVLIVQLYSSSFNNDKKLLAFSDSVQDAAHRAGFFQARTYRFNFRCKRRAAFLG